MEGGDVQFSTHNARNAVFYMGDKGRVCEVQLVLIPSGNRTPEINECNIYMNYG